MGNQSAPAQKPVGQIGVLKFPVKLSFVLSGLVVIAGVIFWCRPTWRDELTFFGTAFAMAAGVLAAYYIGRTLQITVVQREESLTAARIEKAFSYIHRWNAAPFHDRQQWRSLLDKIHGMSPVEIAQLFQNDRADRAVVVDVLNFFEEVALAVNEGLADEDTLLKFFKDMLEGYYHQAAEWINRLRADGTRPRPKVYLQFEILIKRWRD